MKFALSRSLRWELAQMFLHKDLKIQGVDETKAFNRARLGLGLSTPMHIIAIGKSIDPAIVTTEDRTFSFEIESASVDLILTKVFPLQEIGGYRAMVLGEFLEALEIAKATRAAPPTDAPPLEEKEEWLAPEPKGAKCPGCDGTGHLREEPYLKAVE